ncbi:C10 family peptidase [Hymenobacter sp. HD11105]
MKTTILVLGWLTTSFVAPAQIAADQVAQQQPVTLARGRHLLQTNWDQFGIYARYAPAQERLGCWSTALAQILYYHRLRPAGTVNYTCSNGYAVQDTLSRYPLPWHHFAPQLNAGSAPEEIEAVARYSYLTAAAVQKDFGTGRYRLVVNPAGQIEKHYAAQAVFYGSFTGESPLSKAQLDAIATKENIRHLIGPDSVKWVIRREIKAKRPVYFHYGNFTSFGHSTVIDGYHEQHGVFWVHINYGSGGFRTGWYDLFRPIDVADDLMLRAFVTIKPLARQ